LTKLQPALELKIARKAALEAELKTLIAEIEADRKKIAELPGLTEKIQKETSTAMMTRLRKPLHLPNFSGYAPRFRATISSPSP
jgi:hypothetical protein